jgi:hypothetical protein
VQFECARDSRAGRPCHFECATRILRVIPGRGRCHFECGTRILRVVHGRVARATSPNCITTTPAGCPHWGGNLYRLHCDPLLKSASATRSQFKWHGARKLSFAGGCKYGEHRRNFQFFG